MSQPDESAVLFPSETVYTSEDFDVHQDWEVPIPGFFILATKFEARSVADFNDQQLLEFGQVMRTVRQAMASELNIEDVYLFQNEDTAHGFHL